MKNYAIRRILILLAITIFFKLALVSPGQTTTQPAATQAADNPATTQKSARTPIVAPADGKTLELSIKDLGNFPYDFDKGGNIPTDVQKLDGVHFRTSGYMIPLDDAKDIKEFALVADDPSNNGETGPPVIQHTIVVECPSGKAVSYDPGVITVNGVLHVKEQREKGFIISIFQMDAGSVTVAGK